MKKAEFCSFPLLPLHPLLGNYFPSGSLNPHRIWSLSPFSLLIVVSIWCSYGYASMEKQRQRLPVYKYRDAILYLVETHATSIIVGETGSGKTTQIPQVCWLGTTMSSSFPTEFSWCICKCKCLFQRLPVELALLPILSYSLSRSWEFRWIELQMWVLMDHWHWIQMEKKITIVLIYPVS